MVKVKVKLSAVLLLASSFGIAACGASADGSPVSSTSSAVTSADAGGATITFAANWTDVASQPLVAGQPIQIVYDESRLVSECGGTVGTAGVSGGGGFAWAISGYYMLGTMAPSQFSMGSGSGVITPSAAGELQIWFTCGSNYGSSGVDSDYGKNYVFQVGPAPIAGPDAGSADSSESATGTVQIEVVADSVVGNAGATPSDTLLATPISGATVYDGPWEAGGPIGQTDSTGTLTATLSLGTHQIGAMMMTSDESMWGTDGNTVTVTTTPSKLVIHVAPTAVQISTPYNAGMGNAIYVTGETSYLGNWATAYKLTYSSGNSTWEFQKNLPLGAQFKLILAPWVNGSSIPVSSPGVKWASGNNDVVTPPYENVVTILTLNPSF